MTVMMAAVRRERPGGSVRTRPARRRPSPARGRNQAGAESMRQAARGRAAARPVAEQMVPTARRPTGGDGANGAPKTAAAAATTGSHQQTDRQGRNRQHRHPRRRPKPGVPGIRSGSDAVVRRGGKQHETGPVDPPPETARQSAYRERRDFDGQQQIHRHHTEGHGARFPPRCHGQQDLGPAERHVGVGRQADRVEHREDHGEPSEVPVQVEQPRGAGPAP